jgi:hypothetical protein
MAEDAYATFDRVAANAPPGYSAAAAAAAGPSRDAGASAGAFTSAGGNGKDVRWLHDQCGVFAQIQGGASTVRLGTHRVSVAPALLTRAPPLLS